MAIFSHKSNKETRYPTFQPAACLTTVMCYGSTTPCNLDVNKGLRRHGGKKKENQRPIVVTNRGSSALHQLNRGTRLNYSACIAFNLFLSLSLICLALVGLHL